MIRDDEAVEVVHGHDFLPTDSGGWSRPDAQSDPVRDLESNDPEVEEAWRSGTGRRDPVGGSVGLAAAAGTDSSGQGPAVVGSAQGPDSHARLASHGHARRSDPDVLGRWLSSRRCPACPHAWFCRKGMCNCFDCLSGTAGHSTGRLQSMLPLTAPPLTGFCVCPDRICSAHQTLGSCSFRWSATKVSSSL